MTQGPVLTEPGRVLLPSSSLIAKKLGPVHTAFYASSQYAARREFSVTSPKGTVKLEIRGRVSGNDFFLRPSVGTSHLHEHVPRLLNPA
jgi:hypothetical protein